MTPALKCEAEEICFLEKLKNQVLRTAALKGARLEHELFSMLLCYVRLSSCPKGVITYTNVWRAIL